MKIIDFHAHIYPPKIAKRAVESIGEFYNIKMGCDGTAETLLKNGKEAGVSNFLVHSVAVTAHHVETINDFILEECEKHSEFYGFGTMHIDYENKIAEAERIKKAGLLGIKIHPDTQKFNMDDERLMEFYDYLRQNNMPLLIHCGDYRYDYSHPKRLKNLLRQMPGLTVIGAHFGGWIIYDIALEYLENEKCYLDTSSSFPILGLRRGKELIRAYGADRLLFGVDFPMWNHSEEIENMKKLELSQEEYELIFYKNAEKILGTKESKI